MKLMLDPAIAAQLGEKTARLIGAGQELSVFGEMDPGLAGECGVEICSLEARTILSGGAPFRVATLAGESARTRRPVSLSSEDIEAVSRLEAVVAMGSSRIGLQLASLDAAEAQAPLAKIGNLIGFATGAVGLIKTIWP